MGDTDNDERLNFFRFALLILDAATPTLQYLLQKQYFPTTDFQVFLKDKSKKLKKLYRRGKINKDEQELLEPNMGDKPVLEKLDISLVGKLLTNLCPKITKPQSGWKSAPAPTDKSIVADILRLKQAKNELYGHKVGSRMTQTKFQESWKVCDDAITRLSLHLDVKQQEDIKKLVGDAKTAHLNCERESHVNKLIYNLAIADIQYKVEQLIPDEPEDTISDEDEDATNAEIPKNVDGVICIIKEYPDLKSDITKPSGVAIAKCLLERGFIDRDDFDRITCAMSSRRFRTDMLLKKVIHGKPELLQCFFDEFKSWHPRSAIKLSQTAVTEEDRTSFQMVSKCIVTDRSVNNNKGIDDDFCKFSQNYLRDMPDDIDRMNDQLLSHFLVSISEHSKVVQCGESDKKIKNLLEAVKSRNSDVSVVLNVSQANFVEEWRAIICKTAANGHESADVHDSNKCFHLYRLVMEEGTSTLQHFFEKQCSAVGGVEPFLKFKERDCKFLCSVTRIKQWQRDLFLPNSFRAAALNEFDLLYVGVLLINLCSIPKPIKGWKEVPNEDDTSVGADILRLILAWYNLFHHVSGKISDHEFKKTWANVSGAIMRLSVDETQKDDIQRKHAAILDEKTTVGNMKEMCGKLLKLVMHARNKDLQMTLDEIVIIDEDVSHSDDGNQATWRSLRQWIPAAATPLIDAFSSVCEMVFIALEDGSIVLKFRALRDFKVELLDQNFVQKKLRELLRKGYIECQIKDKRPVQVTVYILSPEREGKDEEIHFHIDFEASGSHMEFKGTLTSQEKELLAEEMDPTHLQDWVFGRFQIEKCYEKVVDDIMSWKHLSREDKMELLLDGILELKNGYSMLAEYCKENDEYVFNKVFEKTPMPVEQKNEVDPECKLLYKQGGGLQKLYSLWLKIDKDEGIHEEDLEKEEASLDEEKREIMKEIDMLENTHEEDSRKETWKISETEKVDLKETEQVRKQEQVSAMEKDKGRNKNELKDVQEVEETSGCQEKTFDTSSSPDKTFGIKQTNLESYLSHLNQALELVLQFDKEEEWKENRHCLLKMKDTLSRAIEDTASLISLKTERILSIIWMSWTNLEELEQLLLVEMKEKSYFKCKGVIHWRNIDEKTSDMILKMCLIHIQKAMEILPFLPDDFVSVENFSMKIFISVRRLARVKKNLSAVDYGRVDSIDDEEEMLLLAVWRIRSRLKRLQRELNFIYDDPSFREDKHKYTQKRLRSIWTRMQEVLQDLSQSEKDYMKHQSKNNETKNNLAASIRELQMAIDLLLPEKDLPSEETTNITKLTEATCQVSDSTITDTISKLQATCNQMTSISEPSEALKWAFVCEQNDVCQLLIKKGILLDMLDLIEVVEKAKDTVVFKVIQHLKEINRWKPQDSVASELFVSACKTEMYSLCDLLIQEGVRLDMFDFCQVVQTGSSESFISRVIQHQKETQKWDSHEMEAGKALQWALVYEKNDICEQMMMNKISLNHKHILLIVKNGSVTSIIRLIRYLKERGTIYLLNYVLMGAFIYEKSDIFEILIQERVKLEHSVFFSLCKKGSKSMVIKVIKYMKEENEWNPKYYRAQYVLERAIIKGEEDLYDMLIRDGVKLTMYELPVIVKKAPLIAVKKSIQHLKDVNMWDEYIGSDALKWAFILEKDDVCKLLIENKITLKMHDLPEVVARAPQSAIVKVVQYLKDTNSWNIKLNISSDALEEAFICEKNEICKLLIKDGVTLDMYNFIQVIQKASVSSILKVLQHLKDNKKWNPASYSALLALQWVTCNEIEDVSEILLKEGVQMKISLPPSENMKGKVKLALYPQYQQDKLNVNEKRDLEEQFEVPLQLFQNIKGKEKMAPGVNLEVKKSGIFHLESYPGYHQEMLQVKIKMAGLKSDSESERSEILESPDSATH